MLKGGNPSPQTGMGDPSHALRRGDPGTFFMEGDPEEGDPFLLPLLGAAARFILPAVLPGVIQWGTQKIGELLGGAVSSGAEALMPSSTGTMDPITQVVGEAEGEFPEEEEEEMGF